MKYFGTDGIRGKANDFLSFELAFNLGKSLVVLGKQALVIARDTRESGEMLVRAIKQGAKLSGIDVLDIGIAPTPELSLISQETEFIGIMVTASHNPYFDNGIKVFDAGEKIFLEKEELIEKAMDGELSLPCASRVGVDLPAMNHSEIYEKVFSPYLFKTNDRIGLDFANGATYQTGQAMFSQISDHLMMIGNEPDGKNINAGCGSTHLSSLIFLVKENKLDYGFAFDGDGDRVMMIGSNGLIYDGDFLLYAIAKYLKSTKQLIPNTVVLSQMSNLGILRAFKEEGIEVIQTPVGDKYIVDAIKQGKTSLGAENSGHIINKNLLNTGDGVLNAIYIVYLLNQMNTNIVELCKDITLYPSVIHNIANINKNLAKHHKVIELAEKVQAELGEDGFVLIRPSGTEPVIRVTVSASTDELVKQYIDQFVSLFNSLNVSE